MAYVVTDRKPSAPIDLRAFLKARLPEYMIPSDFVFMQSLPLTPNGKLDRAALPAPKPARRESGRTYLPPRSPAEQTLAAIWREILKLERVGIDDDFFALGGHSLLATQVTSRVRDTFNVELSLRSFFETPTVAGLAAQIARAPAETARVLAELESLSDEEAQLLIIRESSKAI